MHTTEKIEAAQKLYDDCPGNEAYFYQAGDKTKTDAAFAAALQRIPPP